MRKQCGVIRTVILMSGLVATGSPGLYAQAVANDSIEVTAQAPDSIPQIEAVTQSRAEDDEQIRATLQAIFDRVESLDRLEVSVEAGVVVISGIVEDFSAEERALELAQAQPGVLWVEGEIQRDSSLTRQLDTTWERLYELAISLVARTPLFLVAALIIFAAMFVGSRLGRWGGPSFLRTRNPFLRNLLGRVTQTIIVFAGVLIALDLLEATALVGAIAGTAGLAGLALGFAFKDIIENYLAGILLAVRQPFSKNDHIVVGEHDGKVVRLTARETILMTPDGNHVRLPNSVVFRSAMLNYTRNPRRRFDFDAGVGTVDDLALAREAGIEVLLEMKGVMDDPRPEALLVELGDSWVTVRFMGWVDQEVADFHRVRSEAIRLIKFRLEAVGISLPSPEYIVRLVDGMPTQVPESGKISPSPERDFDASAAPAEEADVSPDRSVEEQIEEERRETTEDDLLDSPGASE